MSSIVGRLLPLRAHRGAENMAIDQTLLEVVDATGQPTVRFYAWEVPTLSLGYFQRQSERPGHLGDTSVDCVRRATGGGAILHHRELTYSVVVPSQAWSAGPRLDLYRLTHQSLVETLSHFGVRAAPFRTRSRNVDPSPPEPFLCFQRRTDEDLIVGGYKVVGSAQRKGRASVLQHGSVLLRASHLTPQLPGIEDLTSRAISPDVLAERFAERLAETLGVQWEVSRLTEGERQRVAEVEREKFACPSWSARR